VGGGGVGVFGWGVSFIVWGGIGMMCGVSGVWGGVVWDLGVVFPPLRRSFGL